MVLYLNKLGRFADYNHDLTMAYINNESNGEERLETAIKQVIPPQTNNEEGIVVAVTKQQFFDNKEIIKNKLKELAKKEKNIQFVIDGGSAEIIREGYDTAPIEYSYADKELIELVDFEKELKSFGIKNPIRFNEYYFTRSQNDVKDCWNLKEVVKANAAIDGLIETIKENRFTPYETMIAIHKYLTDGFSYGDNAPEKGRDLEKNRSIVSMIKFGKTTCVGYSSFAKAVIDKLGDPNLTCQTKAIIRMDHGLSECHMICMIDIKDDEYGLDGKYFEDPTLDSKKLQNEPSKGVGHCLHPISDLDFDIIGRKIRFERTSSRTDFGEVDWRNAYGIMSPGCRFWVDFEQGAPISLDTTRKALRSFYTKLGVEEDALDSVVESEIAISALNIQDQTRFNSINPYWGYDFENE